VANKTRVGSDFDQFLQAEGLLEETSAVALKRVIAWQLGEAMKAQRVTKTEMATRMGTSRSQLDRVLGGEGAGMTLETLGRALDALGLRFRLEVQSDRPAPVKAIVRRPKRHTARIRQPREELDLRPRRRRA